MCGLKYTVKGPFKGATVGNGSLRVDPSQKKNLPGCKLWDIQRRAYLIPRFGTGSSNNFHGWAHQLGSRDTHVDIYIYMYIYIYLCIYVYIYMYMY